MTNLRATYLGLILAALIVTAPGCPRVPPSPPEPLPKVPRGPGGAADPVPPRIERPTPPESKGTVPEFPPPVKA